MSEEERKKRSDYRKLRKRLITIQTIVVVAFLVFSIFAAALSRALDKTYHVNYSEKSSVDYGVILKENDFYEESYLGKNYAYIASLIDTVQAKFNYQIDMDSKNPVDFAYSYRVDAVVQIKNATSGKILYAPVYNEVATKSYSTTDNSVKVNQTVLVDYEKYNDLAERFIRTYNLSGTTANLVLEMHVDVLGTSEEFSSTRNSNSYVASVSVPLTSQTVEVKITSAIPAAEQKILSYTTKEQSDVFKTVAIILASVGALLFLVLLAFAYLSRNIDVTYDIKVAKLVRNYKSFIQKLRNKFDTDGYQVLVINTFNEMLEIRDITQSPILMEENEDRTCSKFYIPTNTKLLYLFEIKVDDYDSIYGTVNNEPISYADLSCDDVKDEGVSENEAVAELVKVAAEPVFEAEISAPIESESEEIAEAIEFILEDNSENISEELTKAVLDGIIEESPSDSDNDEDESLAYIDVTGKRINVSCNRSFMANLIQSDERVKNYYTAIKNHILSYKNVKTRLSWKFESYKKGRIQLFKMKIRGKTICLYCALDPNEFDRAKYFHEEALAKTFAAVPMLVRIRSDRGLKKALGLIDTVMEKFAINKLNNPENKNYSDDYPYETTKQLIERKLIKLLLPTMEAKQKLKVKVVIEHNGRSDELTILDGEGVTPTEIAAAIVSPEIKLSEIEYEDTEGATESENGVDVIGVVWKEKTEKCKIYRYASRGESFNVGDTVIVTVFDERRKRSVIKKAVVAIANHTANAPDTHTNRIVGVIHQ